MRYDLDYLSLSRKLRVIEFWGFDSKLRSFDLREEEKIVPVWMKKYSPSKVSKDQQREKKIYFIYFLNYTTVYTEIIIPQTSV